MRILTIRTDKPEAEIGIYNDDKLLDYETWLADKQLAETIHAKLKAILEKQELKLNQVEAILVYKGPGSFTGLRIGLTVANALAYGLSVPIVAEGGDNWKEAGIIRLRSHDDDQLALPEYGAEPHITLPKK